MYLWEFDHTSAAFGLNQPGPSSLSEKATWRMERSSFQVKLYILYYNIPKLTAKKTLKLELDCSWFFLSKHQWLSAAFVVKVSGWWTTPLHVYGSYKILKNEGCGFPWYVQVPWSPWWGTPPLPAPCSHVGLLKDNEAVGSLRNATNSRPVRKGCTTRYES